LQDPSLVDIYAEEAVVNFSFREYAEFVINFIKGFVTGWRRRQGCVALTTTVTTSRRKEITIEEVVKEQTEVRRHKLGSENRIEEHPDTT
jgi:hypothetical protein